MAQRSALVLLLVGTLGLGTSAVAQPERGEQPTFGLGVSLNAVPVVPTAADDIDIPVGFTAPITFFDVRIEPQLGFVRLRRSTDERTRTTTVITFGGGAFYQFHFDDAVLHTGGRIGFSREDLSEQGPSEETSDFTVDMFLGPVVGAEYYVSNHFSVGAEARFLYISVGQPQQAPPDQSASVLQTNGAAFLRFHF